MMTSTTAFSKTKDAFQTYNNMFRKCQSFASTNVFASSAKKENGVGTNFNEENSRSVRCVIEYSINLDTVPKQEPATIKEVPKSKKQLKPERVTTEVKTTIKPVTPVIKPIVKPVIVKPKVVVKTKINL